MTTITSLGARTAAVLASAAFIASVVAPTFADAAGACTFYRDLTIGVQGTDVVCLQTYLISSGFSIPAGATGYFGTQTQGATAAWQAAHGVYPPAGYFGPLSRAEYVTLTSGSAGGGGGGTGGAASLSSYNLVSGDNSVKENQSNVEVATARFTVNNGSASLTRVDLEVQADNSSESTQPWDYLKTIAIYDGSDKIGSVAVGDESDWGTNGGTGNRPVYLVSVDVSDTFPAGRNADLSIQVNSQNSIDNADNGQSFTLDIPDQGVHATDSKNNQLRAGDDHDTVSFNIGGGNGGFSVKGTSDTAVVTSNGSSSYGTFTLKFNVIADGQDVYIPRSISNDPNSDAGVVYDPDMSTGTGGASVHAILTSSADTDGNSYVVHDGDTESFSAQVTIDPVTTGYYEVGLSEIQFAFRLNGALTDLNLDQKDSQYHTDPLYIPN